MKRSNHVLARDGLSIIDVLVCAVLLLLGAVLFIPEIQRRREQARNAICRENLRKIGVAIVNYHSMHDQLPQHGTGTYKFDSGVAGMGDAGVNGEGGKGGGDNAMSLSLFVGILPQLDHQALWETISQPCPTTVSGRLADDANWNPMGPSCGQREYKAWVTDPTFLRCPSDERKSEITGRSNYAACLGDGVDYQMESAFRFSKSKGEWQFDEKAELRIAAAARGPFVYRENMTFDDITDGLSQTLLLGEIATHQLPLCARTACATGYGQQSELAPATTGIAANPVIATKHLDPTRPAYWMEDAVKLAPGKDQHRGLRWADARTVFTGFTTCITPNYILQVEGDSAFGSAVAPISSYHRGGAHVLFADGSTNFISDSIEGGNTWQGTVREGMKGASAPGSPSPYGIWGASGTRASAD